MKKIYSNMSSEQVEDLLSVLRNQQEKEKQEERDYLEAVFMMILVLAAIGFIFWGWGYNVGYKHALKYGTSQNAISHAGASESKGSLEYSCRPNCKLGTEKCETLRCQEVRLSGQE